MKLHPSYKAPWDLNEVLSHSPFIANTGIQGVSLDENGVELKVIPMAHHKNAANLVHGGVIATLLDVACGMPAAFIGSRLDLVTCVTLSLSVNYVGAFRGDVLCAKGRLVGGGRGIAFSRAEVYNDDGTIVAIADGSFKRFFPT